MYEEYIRVASKLAERLLFEYDCCCLSARNLNVESHCIHFAAKLVSVALVFFGLVLPTFSLVFLKSCAFSFFFLLEEPISAQIKACNIFSW